MNNDSDSDFDTPKNGVIIECIGSHYDFLFLIGTETNGYTIAKLSELIGEELSIGRDVILKKRLRCECCGGGGPVVVYGGETWYPGITYFYKDSEGTQQYYLKT